MSPNFDFSNTIWIIIIIVIGIILTLLDRKPILSKDRVMDWATLLTLITINFFAGIPYSTLLGIIIAIMIVRSLTEFIFDYFNKKQN